MLTLLGKMQIIPRPFEDVTSSDDGFLTAIGNGRTGTDGILFVLSFSARDGPRSD